MKSYKRNILFTDIQEYWDEQYYWYIHCWDDDDWDDANNDYHSYDHSEYEYDESFPKCEHPFWHFPESLKNTPYISNLDGRFRLTYGSTTITGLKKINMDSIYSVEVKRDRLIDKILSSYTEEDTSNTLLNILDKI